MAECVDPSYSPARGSVSSETSDLGSNRMPNHPATEKPVPPPAGTYVIQVPKDQVYRVPPPENARRYEQLAGRKHRRGRCCCCLCWLLGLLVFFIVLIGVAAAIFYLIVRPEAPNYSVNSIAIKGFNLTSSSSASTTVSPEFDVAVRADNPNKKIGIYYEKGSTVEIYYSNIKLSDGSLPIFYQPSKNVTVFQAVSKGSSIELSSTENKGLYQSQNGGAVPLKLEVRAPIKLKIGSIKTWKVTVKVSCDVAVDKLTANAKIVSKDCDYGLKNLW